MFFGTRIATHFVQPHIGGDLALLTGIAKAVVESGTHDADFLQHHCNNSEEYLLSLREGKVGRD